MNPVTVGEEVIDPGVGELTDPDDPFQRNRVTTAVIWLSQGFGSLAVRFLSLKEHWDSASMLRQFGVSLPCPTMG